MGLLDRVAMLVRANLNDLVDRAEDPEKMLKQIILDMQNQFMQVKTQVAIAMADQHLLAAKLKENRDSDAEWIQKAELALDKGKEAMARAAADRAVTHRQMAESYAAQLEDQKAQVEQLKSALARLARKLAEARTKSEMLIAQRRRARAVAKAAEARGAIANGESSPALAMERMKDKVQREESIGAAHAELAAPDVEDELMVLGREDQVEQILRDLRSRRAGS
jgi:phage shock protein A